MLLGWLGGRKEIAVRTVDTSPRWRSIDDLSIPKRLIGGLLQGFRDAAIVLLQIVRYRPDIIHLTTSGSLAGIRDLLILSLSRCFGIGSIYHIHFGRIPQLVECGGWEWLLMRGAARLANRVVAIDWATQAALRSVLHEHKVLLIPNAIKTGDLTPLPCESASTSRITLFLGWVIPTKGIAELMKAWCSASSDDWELRVAGPGSLKYRQEVSRLATPRARVRFLGECSPADAWRHILEADIFVLPTYTEGFPYVILEAMAAGKAIVTTRVGAIPEMLDANSEEPCGILVEPRDAGQLATALRRLMENPELRKTLGNRAQKKVNRCYAPDVVFTLLMSLWHEVSGVSTGSPPQPLTRGIRPGKEVMIAGK